MTRAVEALGLEPAWVLVDGNASPRWQRPSKAIVAGDAKCRSIAAASIVAKVTRDRIMADHARDYPGYGWETNRGYPTPEHIRALDALGLTPLHRRSFAPVREIIARDAQPELQLQEMPASESFESHHQRLSPLGPPELKMLWSEVVRTRSVPATVPQPALTSRRLTAESGLTHPCRQQGAETA